MKDWQVCSPTKTGFFVRKNVFTAYIQLVEESKYTSLGRTMATTACAEDVQIVCQVIKIRHADGVHQTPKLIHLIAARGANFQFYKKLKLGMDSPYIKAYCECFPKDSAVINPYRFGELWALFWQAFQVSILKRKSPRFFAFELSALVGKVGGRYTEQGVKFPFALTC
jgi:hypothetical protein